MIIEHQPTEKYVIWHIEGGLGKNIAASSLVGDLSKKYNDRKLIMVVSYPEIFLNNPHIHRVYRIGNTPYFYEDYIKDKDSIVFRQEPYHESGHILKKKHLIENWCKLLDIDYTEQFPQFYPNLIQKSLVNNFMRDRPILLIQTNGGGLSVNTSYSWSRDIPFAIAKDIVDHFSNKYHVIQITKPNSALIPGAEHIVQQASNYELFSLLAASEKRLLIDSSLQHAAAGMGLPSTVLWIGTSPINYGYKIHTNILAKQPKGSTKLIDSYLVDYQLDGLVEECPYNDVYEIFDVNEIIKSI